MTRLADLAPLVTKHAVWLSAFLRGLTRTNADAEEAFQDVWLRVLKAGGVPAGANARAYLARVARTVVIDRHRRVGREDLSLDAPDGTGGTPAESLVADAPLPSERVEASALHEEILLAVRSLPAGPRQTVLLRIEGELTFQEIADELNVPLGTVLTWMRAATARLRKLMGDCHG